MRIGRFKAWKEKKDDKPDDKLHGYGKKLKEGTTQQGLFSSDMLKEKDAI